MNIKNFLFLILWGQCLQQKTLMIILMAVRKQNDIFWLLPEQEKNRPKQLYYS